MNANRPNISPRIRFLILERDGYACQYCGRKAPEVVLNIDHIIPVASGGSNTTANLIAACRDCNQGKGQRIIEFSQRPPAGIGWADAEIARIAGIYDCDKRRKLTYDDRKEIHRRFYSRKVSGETVESIAKDFNVHRQVASRVARDFVPLPEEVAAPSDQNAA